MFSILQHIHNKNKKNNTLPHTAHFEHAQNIVWPDVFNAA